MIFNGTLIVQIGNFIITYWFLKTLFLKKGYTVLTQENAELDEVRTRVGMYQQAAQDAVQKKEQSALAYTKTIHAQKPAVAVESYKSMHIDDEPLTHHAVPTKKMIAELASVVVHKVTHD